MRKILLFTLVGLFQLTAFSQIRVINGGNIGLKTLNTQPVRGQVQINSTRPILFNNNGGSGVYGSEIGFNAILKTDVVPNLFTKLGNTSQRGGSIITTDYYGNMAFQMFDGEAETEKTTTYFPQVYFRNNGSVGINASTCADNEALSIYARKRPVLYAVSNYDIGLIWNKEYGIVNYVNRTRIRTYVVKLGTNDIYWVNGAGEAYARKFSNTNSDSTIKENVVPLKNSLDKVKKLQGVSFTYIPLPPSSDTLIFEDDTMITTTPDPDTNHYLGLIAQKVEPIVPEVVKTADDGKKFIAYEALVPLLIEAIKEQQQQIDELERKVKNKHGKDDKDKKHCDDKKLKSLTTDIDENLNDIAVLYQNTPNPFNQNTEISYYLPDKTMRAVLYIYNMQGSQVKSYNINQRGEGSQIIYGHELSAGMYIYTLIADGVEVDSKRMILTR